MLSDIFTNPDPCVSKGLGGGMESPRIRENLVALTLGVTVQRLLRFSMLSAPLRNTQSDSRGPIYSGK